MKELEKDPPEKLEDWPGDEAKYETFGGSEDGEAVYDEKPRGGPRRATPSATMTTARST